ncbi:MAG: alpha/beta hydrolase [Candidatus Rokubacteria bacterium]|nr:alpha/beta hydrolase [Candidatus Rokubacteria bacterium]
MGEPIFRGYDRAALDREYNNRAKVPDFADYLARYKTASEAARRDLPCRLDVAYGSSPAETLDVFLPTGRPAAIHVFIHGGYWMLLDKADFSFVARALVPAGAAVVVINYGLVPSVDMDELVRQCRAAVAWVWRNAASFGGDPARITVSGHSAGGHLVAMLFATDWPALAGVPADVVKAGCGISGLYDLEPIRLCYLDDTLKLTPGVAERNSPIHLVPRVRAPLLLPVGALEGPEYHRQTYHLAAAWGGRGVACEVLDMPGIQHFSIVSQLEDPGSELARAILGQMGLR